MAFALDHRWVWDFWLARSGPEYHLYYLSAPKSLGDERKRHRNATISHAVSTDLVDWVDLGVVLEPGEATSFDGTATWTGSVVQGHDGLWRMFYTGARFLDPETIANVETIGLATSPDLYTWTKRDRPILAADPRWYERLEDGTWHEEVWRDPWVYFDAGTQLWHMLLTARAATEAEDRGVIGHAVSPDLEQWVAVEPASAPGAGFLHLEVPQLATVHGRRVLLFSCDTPHLAGIRRETGAVGGIWAAPASDPLGPFPTAGAVRLTGEEYYSGRVTEDCDGAPVLLAFRNADENGGFTGELADPIPLAWTADGTLTVAGEAG